MNKKHLLRKAGMTLCILSLTSGVILFETSSKESWNTLFTGIEIMLGLIFIFTFIWTYLQSGIWSFTHKKIEKLDEREITLNDNALRTAYAIFSILVLALLVFYSTQEIIPGIVSSVALILIAHILPASIIVWKEKDIISS